MVEQAMSGAETRAILRRHTPVLAERYGVVELALFGSIVRDEAGPDSDVDILVSFPWRRRCGRRLRRMASAITSGHTLRPARLHLRREDTGHVFTLLEERL